MTGNKYRIEFVPRYGATIGIIWKTPEVEDVDDRDASMNATIKEETIGHVRISSDKEKEEWKLVIEKLNESLSL